MHDLSQITRRWRDNASFYKKKNVVKERERWTKTSLDTQYERERKRGY